jgi:glycosyltransferase involved in cell wall biosynthesis
VKVLLVAPHFYPRTGGVETYTRQIAAGLKELGWQVVIATTGETGAPERATIDGLPAWRLPAALTVSNTPVGYRWRDKLRRVYLAERPDIVNAHTPVPYLADLAERARGSIPFALTYHNDLYKDALIPRAIVTTLQRTMIARTLRRSDRIIVTSEHYLRESAYLSGLEARTGVVPPGVDLVRFHPGVVVGDDLAARYAGRRVLLFVGSLNRSQRHKGVDLLIGVLGRLRAAFADVCLIVAGTGDGVELYQKAARAAGVAGSVDFPGFVPPERLAEYYKLATVFVMPSTNRSEGFGMVYTEAGAVGTPVVGAAVGGVPFAVRDGETGLLVRPGRGEDLYLALARLLEDDGLRVRLGEAGAARARAEFGWPSLARRTSDILTEAIGPARVPRLDRLRNT